MDPPGTAATGIGLRLRIHGDQRMPSGAQLRSTLGRWQSAARDASVGVFTGRLGTGAPKDFGFRIVPSLFDETRRQAGEAWACGFRRYRSDCCYQNCRRLTGSVCEKFMSILWPQALMEDFLHFQCGRTTNLWLAGFAGRLRERISGRLDNVRRRLKWDRDRNAGRCLRRP